MKFSVMTVEYKFHYGDFGNVEKEVEGGEETVPPILSHTHNPITTQ